MNKHINSISCGQGGPSLFLIVLAGEGVFPAEVVIVADTGWERDMLWSNGNRTDAATFFKEVTEPLANEYGMDAAFVRVNDKGGEPYPDLDKFVSSSVKNTDDISKASRFKLPLFGSQGGRLRQSCTGTWKVAAVRQELRRRGAKTATTSLGLTSDEMHRMKISDKKWHTSIWPLLDYQSHPSGDTTTMGIGRTWSRAQIQGELANRGIPYIVTSECDGCPHKDYARWMRTSPETLAELAEFEKQFDGEFFLTSERIPLMDSLALMESKRSTNFFEEIDTCESGYCFT
jgi:hypothetical protein